MALSGILPFGPRPAASGRFYADGVQDLVTLRALGPADRSDQMVRRVEDAGAFYAWDEQSVQVDDGDLFINPDDAPATGRWHKDVPAGGLPGSHGTTHENLGSDEIDVAGLSGELVDPQPPKTHSHTKGDLPAVVAYEDEGNTYTETQIFDKNIDMGDQDGTPVANRTWRVIDGLIRAADTSSVEGRHISKASLEVITNAEVAGGAAIAESKLALNFVTHAEDHRARHILGGADAFLATDFIEAITKRIRTTDGPTDLVVGAIVDGEFLKRVGSTIVGASAGAPFADTTAIVKGSADATKQMRFEVDGLTTATTRVITVPDADITLVDSGAVVLRSGTQTLTGDWDVGSGRKIITDTIQGRSGGTLVLRDGVGNAVVTINQAGTVTITAGNGDVTINGNIKPNADATRTIGLAGTSYATIFTKDLQAGTEGTGILRIRASDASIGLEVETGKIQVFKNIITDTDNTKTLGEDARGFAKVVTNILRPSSTGSPDLIIQDNTGAAAISVRGNGNVEFEGDILTSGGGLRNVGASIQAFGTGFFRNFQPDTGSMILKDASGTDVVTIADAGDMTLSPTGNVIINTTTVTRNMEVDGDNTRDHGSAASRIRNIYANAMVQGDNATFVSMKSNDLGMKFAANDTGIAFFGASTVAKAAALTAIDAATIDATYGATEEGVLNNVRTRLNELESRIQAYNLLS